MRCSPAAARREHVSAAYLTLQLDLWVGTKLLLRMLHQVLIRTLPQVLIHLQTQMLADVSVPGWRQLKLRKELKVRTSLGSSLVASRSSSVRCRQTGTLGMAPPGGQQKCYNSAHVEALPLKVWWLRLGRSKVTY